MLLLAVQVVAGFVNVVGFAVELTVGKIKMKKVNLLYQIKKVIVKINYIFVWFKLFCCFYSSSDIKMKKNNTELNKNKHNLSTHLSDQEKISISPNNINTILSKQVMRIGKKSIRGLLADPIPNSPK